MACLKAPPIIPAGRRSRSFFVFVPFRYPVNWRRAPRGDVGRMAEAIEEQLGRRQIGLFSEYLSVLYPRLSRCVAGSWKNKDVQMNKVTESKRPRQLKRQKDKKKGCNTRTSQEVTHPSTTLAQTRLTSEF
ncbi:hypothetical protein L3X38_032884 [Prunus dulcis]|uniref:Uncharacterized protein n=1 Tax=Prunus dulcis TaxID=3755 RepID=A0AAD4YWA8_PRUDU|nr:hypothetical protein L3X38_032884 [Prunus dulcis]